MAPRTVGEQVIGSVAAPPIAAPDPVVAELAAMLARLGQLGRVDPDDPATAADRVDRIAGLEAVKAAAAAAQLGEVVLFAHPGRRPAGRRTCTPG
jgi:hypothetical protein